MSDCGLIPCSLDEAVQRMLELEASHLGLYSWGAGGYHPENPKQLGMTLGQDTSLGLGWDCAGAAISQAFRLTRHRPGFNRQMHATISDDINVDSILEDADPARGGRQELGELVTTPAPGILLLTPTIDWPEKDFHEPGHVRMIVDVSRCDARWDPAAPDWSLVTYLECRGPSGRKPGVVRDDGASVNEYSKKWPVDFTRPNDVLVRVKPAMVRIRYQP